MMRNRVIPSTRSEQETSGVFIIDDDGNFVKTISEECFTEQEVKLFNLMSSSPKYKKTFQVKDDPSGYTHQCSGVVDNIVVSSNGECFWDNDKLIWGE